MRLFHEPGVGRFPVLDAHPAKLLAYNLWPEVGGRHMEAPLYQCTDYARGGSDDKDSWCVPLPICGAFALKNPFYFISEYLRPGHIFGVWCVIERYLVVCRP